MVEIRDDIAGLGQGVMRAWLCNRWIETPQKRSRGAG
jgi:hypothetical protein